MICQSCIRGGLEGSSEDDAISLSFGTFIQSSETTNNVPFTEITFSNTVYPANVVHKHSNLPQQVDRELTRCMRNHPRQRHVSSPPQKLVLHRDTRTQTHAPMVCPSIALPPRPLPSQAPTEVVHHRITPTTGMRGVPTGDTRHFALAPLPVADNEVLELVPPLRWTAAVRVESGVFRSETYQTRDPWSVFLSRFWKADDSRGLGRHINGRSQRFWYVVGPSDSLPRQ